MKKLALLFLTASYLVVGCKDKSIDGNAITDDTAPQENLDLRSVESLLAYAEKVDLQLSESGKMMPSLSFSNDDENYKVVLYTLQNLPVKVEEHFMSNSKNSSGIRTFYLKNDTLLMTKELRDELFPDGSFQMRETQLFYEKGKLVKTIERSALYEEDLQFAAFKESNSKEINMDNARQILSLSGPYQTNYLGHLEAAGSTFLLLGDAAPTGFTTALLLEYRDPFVKMLLDQKEKFKGKRLQVEFEVVSYEGVEYQAYRSGKLVE
jgi:hypothetical protein